MMILLGMLHCLLVFRLNMLMYIHQKNIQNREKRFLLENPMVIY